MQWCGEQSTRAGNYARRRKDIGEVDSKVHPSVQCQGFDGSISVTAGNLEPQSSSSRPHHPLSRHQFDFTRLPTTTDVNLDDTDFRICHWQIPTFTQGRLHQHTSLPWSTGKHMNQLAARMQRQRQRQRQTPLTDRLLL